MDDYYIDRFVITQHQSDLNGGLAHLPMKLRLMWLHAFAYPTVQCGM